MVTDRLSAFTTFEVRNGCPITYEVRSSGTAWFQLGEERDGLEFDFESEVLRELVRLGTEALGTMDERFAGES